jgi:hypothetical protein
LRDTHRTDNAGNYQRPVVVAVSVDYNRKLESIFDWLVLPSSIDRCPPMLFTVIWSFLIYAVILYVVSYIVVEYGQKYLYDEITPGTPLKVLLGSVILAGLLTYTRTGFETLAIVWSGVFILIYRFQPWHGFGLAMATMLIFAGLSTLVVSSLTQPKPAGRIEDVDHPPQNIRRPSSGLIVAPPTEKK